MPQCLEAKRVAHPDEMIRRSRGQAHAYMKIELLVWPVLYAVPMCKRCLGPPCSGKSPAYSTKASHRFVSCRSSRNVVSPVTFRWPTGVGQYTDIIPAAVQFEERVRDQGSSTNGS